tara:strand:+ start:6954 stop:7427 length:474 start_codon:yes stop_codon:yes gene_type:complete
MAKQGITISMFSNIEKNVKKAEKLYQLNASRHVNRVATNFRNDIMRGMQQTPKDGREYPRGKKTHVASSSGNPPAIDTGRLINSITTRLATAGNQPTATVMSNMDYSARLELVLDRPFMGDESIAYNKARIFANKIAKQVSIDKQFKPIKVAPAKVR